jgi:hypothetical protein
LYHHDELKRQTLTMAAGGSVNQARRSSAGTPERAGDADEEGWSVSVEVEELEILDELKEASCYGGSEKKKTLLKSLVRYRTQLLERILVLSPHLHGSAELTIPTEDKHVNKLTVLDVVVKLMEARTILTDFFSRDDGTTTSTRVVRSLLEVLTQLKAWRLLSVSSQKVANPISHAFLFVKPGRAVQSQ